MDGVLFMAEFNVILVDNLRIYLIILVKCSKLFSSSKVVDN